MYKVTNLFLLAMLAFVIGFICYPVGAQAGPAIPGVTFYSDRSDCDAACPDLLVEDFENSNCLSNQTEGLPSPLNDLSNDTCFTPGQIQPGIEFLTNNPPGPNELAFAGSATGNGNPSDVVVANTFVDTYIINFPNNDVDTVCMDVTTLASPGPGPCNIEIFGSGGSLGIIQVPCTPAGNFLGFSLDSDILAQVSIFDISNGAEGADNIAFGSCVSTQLVKELLEGPEQIGIYLPDPTLYVFEITYTGPDALVVDTVPAEFEILSLETSAGNAIFFDTSKGRGNSANRIEWFVLAGSNTLTVTIQTVPSPGKGHKEGTVFKPTSCGPLPINDGATAFEVDENGELVLVEVVDPATGELTLERVVIVGPSNFLEVEAVDGAKPCVEVEEEEEVVEE